MRAIIEAIWFILSAMHSMAKVDNFSAGYKTRLQNRFKFFFTDTPLTLPVGACARRNEDRMGNGQGKDRFDEKEFKN